MPVLRRERIAENNSGSLSMNGGSECEVREEDRAMVERKELGPARVRVCRVVWKIWPPTLRVTMSDSDWGFRDPVDDSIDPSGDRSPETNPAGNKDTETELIA